VYVILVVPDVMPHNTPVAPSIVPTAKELLAHVPPGVDVVNVVHEPVHTCRLPVMLAGRAYTVTIALAEQVVGKV